MIPRAGIRRSSPTSLEDLEEEYDPGACDNFYRYNNMIIVIAQ